MTIPLASIRKVDARLSAITHQLPAKVAAALKGSRFEESGVVLTSLVDRLGCLKRGILDLAESDNFYAMSVLFRVFLEHTLRANAVFMKAACDGSDEFARKYMRLGLVEAFEYLKACEAAGIEVPENPSSPLNQWFPHARSLTGNDIRKLGEPFRYRVLIATIRGLIGASSPDFLAKIIPNYSELSGFVHGGPTAAQVVEHFADDARRQEEVIRVSELTVAMFHSAERWGLLLATSRQPSLQPVLDELSAAMADGADSSGPVPPGTRAPGH